MRHFTKKRGFILFLLGLFLCVGCDKSEDYLNLSERENYYRILSSEKFKYLSFIQSDEFEQHYRDSVMNCSYSEVQSKYHYFNFYVSELSTIRSEDFALYIYLLSKVENGSQTKSYDIPDVIIVPPDTWSQDNLPYLNAVLSALGRSCGTCQTAILESLSSMPYPYDEYASRMCEKTNYYQSSAIGSFRGITDGLLGFDWNMLYIHTDNALSWVNCTHPLNPTGGGGSGGGTTPPTNPDGETEKERAIKQNAPRASKIINLKSNLTLEQWIEVENIFEKMVGIDKIVEKIKTLGGDNIINLKIDPNAESYLRGWNMTLSEISYDHVAEEFFHSYQRACNGAPTNSNNLNREFEAKFYTFTSGTILGSGGGFFLPPESECGTIFDRWYDPNYKKLEAGIPVPKMADDDYNRMMQSYKDNAGAPYNTMGYEPNYGFDLALDLFLK